MHINPYPSNRPPVQQPAFVNCPWCTSRNANNQLNCTQCGGPLPPPVGENPGQKPPMPPRSLPKGYRTRVMFRGTPLFLVGFIFTLVGAPFALVFPVVGFAVGDYIFPIIGCLLGGGFVALGLAFTFFGYRSAEGKIRPFQYGVPTTGKIVDVHLDTSIAVNGRSPYAVIYQFEVMGQLFEGKVLSWNYAAHQQTPGNVVWVLYMQDNPNQNVIYPPVS